MRPNLPTGRKLSLGLDYFTNAKTTNSNTERLREPLTHRGPRLDSSGTDSELSASGGKSNSNTSNTKRELKDTFTNLNKYTDTKDLKFNLFSHLNTKNKNKNKNKNVKTKTLNFD